MEFWDRDMFILRYGVLGYVYPPIYICTMKTIPFIRLGYVYPLVNCPITMENHHAIILMGKSTISMAIFNSYAMLVSALFYSDKSTIQPPSGLKQLSHPHINGWK